MCWLKKTTWHDPNVNPNLIKNTCVTLLSTGWWANPTHHGFNPNELCSRWAESKINPYWNL